MSIAERIEKHIVEEGIKAGNPIIRPVIKGAGQYYKWLSYIPDSLKEKIDTITKKAVNELDDDDIFSLKKFQAEQMAQKQLAIYFSDDWSELDYEFIKNFIRDYDLMDIIRERLTEEEYNLANTKIKYYIEDIHQIRSYEVQPFQTEEYFNMSMIDAYVFQAIYEHDMALNKAAMREYMKERIKRNDHARARSHISASQSFVS